MGIQAYDVICSLKIMVICYIWGTRWRSWLRDCAKAGRLRVRFPMVSLEFCIDYGPGVDSASNRNEYQGYLLGGVKAAGAWGWQPYLSRLVNLYLLCRQLLKCSVVVVVSFQVLMSVTQDYCLIGCDVMYFGRSYRNFWCSYCLHVQGKRVYIFHTIREPGQTLVPKILLLLLWSSSPLSHQSSLLINSSITDAI
jgi:hypothetical protein